jgi:hypothetical protein
LLSGPAKYRSLPAARRLRRWSEYRAYGEMAATHPVDTNPAGKERLGCASWLAGPTNRKREYRPYGERIPTLWGKPVP